MTTFIDTNVIIDVLDSAAAKHASCIDKLDEAMAKGPVFICDVVYSEASMGMSNKGAIDAALALLHLTRAPFSDEALYRAGLAYKQYKDVNNGPKNNVLPDFFIGAQAEVDNSPLISSDHKRMTSYFPALEVICP